MLLYTTAIRLHVDHGLTGGESALARQPPGFGNYLGEVVGKNVDSCDHILSIPCFKIEWAKRRRA
jgi:hypothetical protein